MHGVEPSARLPHSLIPSTTPHSTILESATAGSSAATASANLCLRDLCRDTLAFVASSSSSPAQSDGSSSGQQPGASSSPGPSQPQPPQQLDVSLAADAHEQQPLAFASPPLSPQGETTNERSPLKGPRARRSSSGNNNNNSSSSSAVVANALGGSGNGGGGGDRVSSLGRRRLSLLDALLPPPTGGGEGGPGPGQQQPGQQQQPQVTLLSGPWDVGAAPIVDIGAVFGSDPVPDGFARVSATPGGRRADLNAGAGGHYIYLTLKRDATRRRPPVVALALIFPDRQEFVPPTFRWVWRLWVVGCGWA